MAFPATVEPDPRQAVALLEALFPFGSVILFRSVPEPKDGREAINHFYERNAHFANTISDFLNYCASDRRAAFYLPAVVPTGKTGKNDVTALPAVLVDLDKGDTTANLAELEKELGPATAIIESGGTTETGAPKLHVYHILEPASTGAPDVATACKVRETLALRFHGDPSFKQSAQVVRLPGSVHFKGEPKLVRLRSITTNRYQLPTIVSALGVSRSPTTTTDNFFDFNNATPPRDGLDRALTAPVHSEGKDGITRFDAASKALGHFIRMARERRMTDEEAWRAACEWNAATLVPPWDEDRLRTDYERLRDIDLRQHGPIVRPAVVQAPTEEFKITDWHASRYSGEPPPMVWTVDGVLPAGVAGTFVGDSGAGKTGLLLKLALDITTLPPMSAGLAFPPRFFGGDVVARGAAVIFTHEDNARRIHARLKALDPTQSYVSRPLYIVPTISAGGARPLVTQGPNKTTVITEHFANLAAQLKAIPDLRLIAFDPLAYLVNGELNSNEMGLALLSALSKLAEETGATVVATHHPKKESAPPTSLKDAAERMMGAGAFKNNARFTLVLYEQEENKAYDALKMLGQVERASTEGIVFVGGLGKNNETGTKEKRTFIRNKETGLLEDVTDILRRSAPKKDELDAAVCQALRAIKLADPKFSFASSRGAIDRAQVHRKIKGATGLDISLTKLTESVGRLVDEGLLVPTADSGKTVYYEPKMD